MAPDDMVGEADEGRTTLMLGVTRATKGPVAPTGAQPIGTPPDMFGPPSRDMSWPSTLVDCSRRGQLINPI
uniref:Uncharacterized protein n=1 Tax=Arundo donax TaxID=35708 RepID=A0A0A9HFA8_ARUDO